MNRNSEVTPPLFLVFRLLSYLFARLAMATCLLSLGSNLGDRRQNLIQAVAQIESHADVTVTAQSSLLEFRPFGGPPGQQDFLNSALLIETGCSPVELLTFLRQVEAQMGRRRIQRWEARIIDLDILLFDSLCIRTDQLQIPHPRMPTRRFVLEPAAEIASEMLHPQLGWTIRRLLKHLTSYPPIYVLGAAQSNSPVLMQVGQVTGSDVISRAKFVCNPGSAVLTFAEQIEFLEQCHKILARGAWSSGSSSIISDFWLDECLIVAEKTLSDSELDDYRHEFERVSNKVKQPKLLIMGQQIDRRSAEPNTHSESPQSRAQPAPRDIRRRAEQLRLFPILEIDSNDSDRLVDDFVVAIESMR